MYAEWFKMTPSFNLLFRTVFLLDKQLIPVSYVYLQCIEVRSWKRCTDAGYIFEALFFKVTNNKSRINSGKKNFFSSDFATSGNSLPNVNVSAVATKYS